MKFVQQLFLYIGVTSVVFLLIGLFRPWIMLWWEDQQNRRKVLSVYGAIAGISFAIYFGMRFIAK